jgi:hypothetical protein
MARSLITPNAHGPGHTCFWMDPDRRQRQKTFRRKVDAENFRTRKERELDTDTYLETAGRQYETGSAELLRELAGGAEGQADG